MATAKANGRVPRDLAGELVERLNAAPPAHVDRAEIAGPGFVNFHLRETWLHDVLGEVLAAGEDGYARLDLGDGTKVNVEFVSANPTGPLHAGDGRWAAYGDSLCRILERDRPRGAPRVLPQRPRRADGALRRLARRPQGRNRPPRGRLPGRVHQRVGGRDARRRRPGRVGLRPGEAATCATAWRGIGVDFDTWFERAVPGRLGRVDAALADLRDRGVVFEDDGATWLRTTDFGDDKDRVLVKSDGEPTYLLPDIAYHRNKFARGLRAADRRLGRRPPRLRRAG